ncbi:hypothetical protein [Natrinema salsiterrestre]|uniref:Uncharacterized protein n=1 Tax=Natrinema salsiterrestre TaxID=2950540 RepID=A0A9Q4L2V2_9EURY|nr:hypothetical protein [Natrinema salsiterrestre]MDF9746344.1 hypothetical protein [Natrinema salsiterrestre]
MLRESLARFRDRIDPSDIVVSAGVAVVLLRLGVDASLIGTVLGAAVVTPLAEPLLERFDIGPGIAGIAFGAFAIAAGVVQLQDGGRLFGGSLLAIGFWICLDGVYTWRTGDGTARDEEDMTEDELLLVGEHNRWLLEELRAADRPLTKAEICDRTGLLDEDFERLLEIHGDSGPIERVGNGYAIDEDEMGASAFVRNVVYAVFARLFRPFRLFRSAG